MMQPGSYRAGAGAVAAERHKTIFSAAASNRATFFSR